MMLRLYFLILATLLALETQAQEPEPLFTAANFRSVELKAGLGKLQPQMLAIDLNYQRNLFRHLSVVSLSQVSFSAWGTNPDKNYLVVNYLHATQTVGLGPTLGTRGFNVGVFVTGGARIYHSRAVVESLYQSEITTNRLLPEVGLLYNIKIGKKRTYFSAQVYMPLTPFGMAFFEKNTTFTFGAGCRLGKR